MQGQRSAIGSLPDTLGFDHGPTPSEAGTEPQIWNNIRNSEGQNFSGWSMGGPSSSAGLTQVNNNEQKVEQTWASSMSGPILEDRQCEPASVNLNLSSNQIANGPLFPESSISQNLNINPGFEGQGVDVFKSGSSENSRFPSGSCSSNPLGLRTGGFLEDDDDRPEYSLEGRRLSCKRKAIEGNVGQSSGSGSLTISGPPENTFGINRAEQVQQRRESSLAGSAERSRRNFRLRINSLQQESIFPNGLATGSGTVPGSTNVSSSHHQSSRVLPVNNSLDVRSPEVTNSENSQIQSLLAHVPAMRRNLQSSRWNRSLSSRPGSSSSFAAAVERDGGVSHEESSRIMSSNISGEHPIFVPASGRRNSSQIPINWSSNIVGGDAGSSRSGSTSGVNQSSGPNWVPPRNSPHYPRRLSEFVRRSLMASSSGPESGGQNGNISPPGSGASSSQELTAPSAGDEGHHLPHSRSAMLLDRHLDGALGIRQSLRNLAAASEGRSRLVSEIRNVLDLMRRGEGLRFEDVMLLDHSVLFGVSDIHDRHRDMRLDVDNMSYEELLALEERIGNVNTGLSEETISSRLKQTKYALVAKDQREAEPCCICQEEYKTGDDLGKLECGHDFHAECIKQWLTQKNLCPICKTTAMGT